MSKPVTLEELNALADRAVANQQGCIGSILHALIGSLLAGSVRRLAAHIDPFTASEIDRIDAIERRN